MTDSTIDCKHVKALEELLIFANPTRLNIGLRNMLLDHLSCDLVHSSPDFKEFVEDLRFLFIFLDHIIEE